MSNWSKLLKPCAVVSSLVLAVGFIYYRAGAFDRWIKPDKSEVFKNISGSLSSSKSGGIFVPDDYDLLIDNEKSPTPPAPKANEPTKPTEKDRTIMSGSKSFLPSGPPPQP